MKGPPAWAGLLLLLLAATQAVPAHGSPPTAAGSGAAGSYRCSLSLRGTGRPSRPLEAATLSCTGPPGRGSLPIGINATHLGSHARSFRGVRVVRQLACQAQAEALNTEAVFALLYFCDGRVVFEAPSVRDVVLGGSAQQVWTTALVAFGGTATAVLQRARFSNNGNQGPALLALDGAHVALQDGSVIAGGRKGAAGVWMRDRSTLLLSDSQIRQTTAVGINFDSCGGAVLATGSSQLTIRRSALTNNSAIGSGGAVSKDGRDAGLTLASGGGVCMRELANATIEDSILANNSALWGGGVFLQDSATVLLRNTTLRGNTGKLQGGALFAQDSTSIDASNCSLVGNHGGLGGATYNQDNSILRLNYSRVVGNVASHSGGGFSANDVCSVTVVGSHFTNNSALSGAAGFVSDLARVTWRNCTASANQATSQGGALMAKDTSQLLLLHSRLVDNSAARRGGALAIVDHARLELHHSALVRGTTQGCGGGLNVGVLASADVLDSVIEDCSGSSGGGICCEDTSTLSLRGASLVRNNRASANGGGVALDGTAQLSLPPGDNSRIEGNAAGGWGGGAWLHSGNFSLAALQAAVASSNTAKHDPRIGSPPIRLALLGGAHVRGFASQLGPNVGLLHTSLNVTGHQGVPCGGVLVQARVAATGRFLGVNASDAAGVVRLVLKVQEAAGPHALAFTVVDSLAVAPAVLQLDVRACALGEVQASAYACQRCPVGYYSLQPRNAVCSACPSGADCPGGAVMVPQPGRWSSHPRSNQFHKCPSATACTGNRAALQACATNASCALSPAFTQLQCAPEYAGKLCGGCAPGHGTSKPFNCLKCMPPSVIVGLYAAAAVLTLACIKLLCSAQANELQAPQHRQRLQHLKTLKTFRSHLAAQNSSQLQVQRSATGSGTSAASTGQLQVQPLQPTSSSVFANGAAAAAIGSASTTAGSPRGADDAWLVGVGPLGGATSPALPSCTSTLPCLSSSSVPAAGGSGPAVRPAALLKLLVLYLQYVAIVSQLSVDWPPPLAHTMRGIKLVMLSTAAGTISLDCLLRRGAVLSPGLQAVLIELAVPLAMLALLLVGRGVAVALRRWRMKHQVRHYTSAQLDVAGRLGSTTIIVGYFFYPSVLRSILSLFACIPVDAPAAPPFAAAAVGSFWLRDLSQDCSSASYRAWALGLGLPLLLTACILMPAAIVFTTMRWRLRMNEQKFAANFSFLYESYRGNRAFWESVVAVQTSVLVAIGMFGYTVGALAQTVAMSFALLLIVALHLACRPLASRAAMVVALQSLGCLLLLVHAAFTFIARPGELATAAYQTYKDAVGSIVLAVNLLFIAHVLWRLARLVPWPCLRTLRLRLAAVRQPAAALARAGRSPSPPGQAAAGAAKASL